MRKIHCSIPLLALACCAASLLSWHTSPTGFDLKYEDTTGQLKVKVMTFNIRYDNPGDGPSRWDLRKDQVARVISRQKPDFLGLQEALKHQCTDVASLAPAYDWIGVGRDDGLDGGEYSPIYYLRAKWALEDWGTIWLSETPDVPSRGWDAALPRIATWARLRHRKSGREVLVFNTHFDHRGEQARVESAVLLRRKVGAMAGLLPFVVMGDFNFGPESPGYEALTDDHGGVFLKDARVHPLKAPKGPLGTFSGFEVSAPLPTVPIDHIFCHRQGKVLRYEVLIRSKDGLYASDHFAVAATIRL